MIGTPVSPVNELEGRRSFVRFIALEGSTIEEEQPQ
jgi:hypothetical protein